MCSLSGKTRVLGIIGDPVGHSLSPAIQNAAIQTCNLDYVYIPFPVTPEGLATAVYGLRALGVCGFNVTIPHKTAIMCYLDELDESAAAAGAVNTVKVSDGRMIGYNTDGDGFLRSLADDLNFVPGVIDTVILVGAGGAARGAVAALCRAGVGKIVVANRSLDKAFNLMEDMKTRYPKTCIEVTLLDKISDDQLGSASLLVNTTSIGMGGDGMDFLNLAKLPKAAIILDMVYSPTETMLLRNAALIGITAVNGLGMLAAQGELAFTIWTGEIPPKGLMKSVLQSICCP